MKKEKPKPYYGISCLHDRKQMQDILTYVKAKKITGRRIMAGTHMSSASFRGFEVEHPKRTLRLDEVRSIYSSIERPKQRGPDRDWFDANVFRVVQFNSEGPAVIDAELLLVNQMIHIPDGGREVNVIDQFVEGFQINHALPNPDKLRWFRDKQMWRNMQIILQLGELAMEETGNDPEGLAVLVESYGDAIDYVLWDGSEDHQAVFDAEFARPYLRAIREHCPDLGIAVSGNLGPNSMRLVDPLRAEFPDLSVDAESELRDENDSLLMAKALSYLDECAKRWEKKINIEDC
ncbi:MAG: hypothetical protein Q7S19_03040 [bacterium]|nr:hypothetical protein [bacterium]